MLKPVIFFVLWAGSTYAQSGPAFRPENLFQRAAARVEANADQLPRFTCSETVIRSLYTRKMGAPGEIVPNAPLAGVLSEAETGRVLAWRDRMRVEVAVFDGRELFAWQHGGKFDSNGLDDLAGGGPTSSGEFGSFGISVLLSDADPLSFRFRGMRSLSGREMAEFAYRVPLESSHYSVQMGHEGTGHPAATPYEGYFWIDTETADLRRMVVEVTQPPSGSQVRRSLVVTDYEQKAIGSRTALLPTNSTLRLLSDINNLAINHTEYGDCREYVGTSTLSFDLEPRALAKDSGYVDHPQSVTPLPAGLEIQATVVGKVDTESTYTGDLVSFRVLKDVKEKRGPTVIPKGALLHGRVVRFERQFFPTRRVTLGIRFDTAEFGGTSIPVLLAAYGGKPQERLVRPGYEMPARPMAAPSRIEHREHVATVTVFGQSEMRIEGDMLVRLITW